MFNLVRSLGLTLMLSFTAPIVLLGGLFAALQALAYFPWLAVWGRWGAGQLTEFLVVFGNGSPWPGLLVIAGACSVVAACFDLFNFCFYRGDTI